MKKSILSVAVVATMMLGFTSCNCAPKAELNTETDSLAYCYGVDITRSSHLHEYLAYLGIDSAQTDAFVKGVVKAMDMSADEKAEMVGMQVGQQVMQQMMPQIEMMITGNDSSVVFDKDNFMAGFIAGVYKDDRIVNAEEAKAYITESQERQELKKYGEWKAENEEYLVANAEKTGVVTLPSGLQYEVLKAGNGAKPTAESRVKVHYHGTLIDGTVFDSSVERKQPAVFGVKQVISGWQEALQLMPVGSIWRLYIPQDLAYGSAEQGTIKPFSTLIFEVELLEIEK